MESDPDAVSTALDVGSAMWARGDRSEALKWLRKAVDEAFDAGLDERGLDLSKSAAALATTSQPAAPVTSEKPAAIAPEAAPRSPAQVVPAMTGATLPAPGIAEPDQRAEPEKRVGPEKAPEKLPEPARASPESGPPESLPPSALIEVGGSRTPTLFGVTTKPPPPPAEALRPGAAAFLAPQEATIIHMVAPPPETPPPAAPAASEDAPTGDATSGEPTSGDATSGDVEHDDSPPLPLPDAKGRTPLPRRPSGRPSFDRAMITPLARMPGGRLSSILQAKDHEPAGARPAAPGEETHHADAAHEVALATPLHGTPAAVVHGPEHAVSASPTDRTEHVPAHDAGARLTPVADAREVAGLVASIHAKEPPPPTVEIGPEPVASGVPAAPSAGARPALAPPLAHAPQRRLRTPAAPAAAARTRVPAAEHHERVTVPAAAWVSTVAVRVAVFRDASGVRIRPLGDEGLSAGEAEASLVGAAGGDALLAVLRSAPTR